MALSEKDNQFLWRAGFRRGLTLRDEGKVVYCDGHMAITGDYRRLDPEVAKLTTGKDSEQAKLRLNQGFTAAMNIRSGIVADTAHPLPPAEQAERVFDLSDN